MEHRQVIRSTSLIGGFTAISRVMGLIRDMLMADRFGMTGAMSAFVIAFRIPNMFRALFGEGALSAAFIPVFVETRHREGDDGAWQLARRVFTMVGWTLAALVLAGILVATVGLNLAGVGEQARRILSLARIMLPYLYFICMAAVAMGALNAFHHFAVPALTPWLLNVTLIVGMLFVCPYLGADPNRQIFGVAYAVLVAGLLQWFAQWPVLLRLGWSPRPLRPDRDPRLLRMLMLMGPAALGRAVTQVNVMVDTFLAALIGPWAAAALYYSERLIYLPLGIFATALSTVLLPVFSGQAARTDHAALLATVRRSLGTLLFVMIPASIGLFALREPIVRVLFERGLFTSESTRLAALALGFYAPGMVVFSLGKVFVPAFYALQDTRTPVRVGVWTVALNIALSILFMKTWPLYWKHAGIAFATVIAETLNAVVLATLLHRRVGSPGWRLVGLGALRALLCSGGMALAARGTFAALETRVPGGLMGQVGSLVGAIGVGMLVFLTLARQMRAPEWKELMDALRRRKRTPSGKRT